MFVSLVAPLQQQSQVTFYGSYMKLYFNSILLHRILVENDDNVSDPAATEALSICHVSSMKVLIEARRFGNMDLLYYFWDSAHLTSAYSAMMLLKVLNLSSALPETAVPDALEVLTGLLAAYTTTAQEMAWRPEDPPKPVDSDRTPVANGLEAQARAAAVDHRSAQRALGVGMSHTADRQRIYRHDPFHVRPDTDPGGSRGLEVPRPPI